MRESGLSPAEVEKVKHHALESARIVAGYPKMPIGAEQIIKQHHGSLTGIGLPNIITPEISPLAIIFMIAEDFVTLALKYNEKAPDKEIDIKGIIGLLKKKHSRASLVPIVNALSKSLLGV